jgi:hypothetical protein
MLWLTAINNHHPAFCRIHPEFDVTNDSRKETDVISTIIQHMMRENMITQATLARETNISSSSLNDAIKGLRKKDCSNVFIPVLRHLNYDPTVAAIIASCPTPDYELAYNHEFVENGGQLWWDIATDLPANPSPNAILAFCTWCKEHLTKWYSLKYLDMFQIDDLKHTVRFAEHLSTLTPARG